MFLDLHTHSVSSDDSRAEVEQYAKWVGVLRRRGYRVDGFVLTEHRKFDAHKDYSGLANDHQVTILKGSELDTDHGHFLVYGVTEELTRQVDFAQVGLDAAQLIRCAEECGAMAVPAHPGRFGIGLCEFDSANANLGRIRVVEQLNGSDRPGERERADELVRGHGYLGTGGSDAHLASAIGACMTRFDENISDEADLVRQLRAGAFRPVRLEETREQASA